jgi:hypothetical protein
MIVTWFQNSCAIEIVRSTLYQQIVGVKGFIDNHHQVRLF